jgi:hypothetical protein
LKIQLTLYSSLFSKPATKQSEKSNKSIKTRHMVKIS